MMTTALGVAVDSNGNGLDALTYRRLIRQLWHNTGVIGGLTVSGLSSLYYQVAAGAAVCSMADSDGYTQAYWPGGTTENPVSAGDATYPRIDTVYILANTGTPDNLVHVAVASGTPAASPVKPSLPTGALEIMSMLMPAGATSTSSATQYGSVDYAIPYAAQLGRLAYETATVDYPVPEDTSNGKMVWHKLIATQFNVPTDRLVNISFESASTVGTSGSSATEVNSRMGSYFAQFRVNGDVVNDTTIGNGSVSGNGWEIDSNRYYTPRKVDLDVTVQKGVNTVEVWVCGNNGNYTYPVTLKLKRILKVEDRGVAK